MAIATSFPLSEIVDVAAEVSATAVAGPTYNTGCIVGPTRIVGQSGVPSRVTPYYNTSAMIASGYIPTSPEVVAAQNYFAQSPAPPLVYIGLQDGTAIESAAIGTPGQSYGVGDVVAVAQANAQGGSFTVSAVGANGAVTAVQQTAGGTGYSVASNIPTTGGLGTGLELNVTSIGETVLQAVTACRAASSNFYGMSVCGAAKADVLATMEFVESASPDTGYFPVTADADALAALPNSILAEAKAGGFKNSVITVSTTQGGAYVSNAYMGAAVMGRALGMFTGLAGSYFTLNNKSLAGVFPEPMSPAQASAIFAQNGNLYLGFGSNNQFTLYQSGVTPAGTFFDETIFSKAFVSAIQYACVNVLVTQQVVRQTDGDQEQFLNAVTSVCEQYVQMGWIAPGIYDGPTIVPTTGGIAITNGQSLPKGYSVQSPAYATQSQAARDARQAMPVYVFVTLAGAVHSLSVAVSISL